MILANRIDPFLLAIATTLAMLSVLAIVFYAQLIILLIILIVAVRIGIYKGYIEPKLTKINNSKVIKISGDETNIFYPIILEIKTENKLTPEAYYRVDWLFKIYYFIRGRKQWQVRAILPEIEEYDVNLQEGFYDLKEVKIIDSSDNNLKFQTNKYLATTVKKLCKKIKPKINNLKEKNEEINKELEVLVLQPKIYQKKIELYSKLEKQTAKLYQTGEKLTEGSLDLIRDILIGADLAQIKPENIPEVPDKKKQFDRQCEIFLEKYQTCNKQLESGLESSSGDYKKSR